MCLVRWHFTRSICIHNVFYRHRKWKGRDVCWVGWDNCMGLWLSCAIWASPAQYVVTTLRLGLSCHVPTKLDPEKHGQTPQIHDLISRLNICTNQKLISVNHNSLHRNLFAWYNWLRFSPNLEVGNSSQIVLTKIITTTFNVAPGKEGFL